MLNTVSQLTQNILGYISGILSDKINSHAFGSDQPCNLFDFIHQCFGCVFEQKMGLIKEKDQLGFIRVTHFGKRFKQFRQEPQKKARIKARCSHQSICRKNIYAPQPRGISRNHVSQIKSRFTKDFGCALVLKHQKPALNGSNGLDRYISVTQRQLLAVLPQPDEQRLDIFDIQQSQTLFIGQSESNVQDAFLRLAQFKKLRQQQRPHLSDSCADGMACFTE